MNRAGDRDRNIGGSGKKPRNEGTVKRLRVLSAPGAVGRLPGNDTFGEHQKPRAGICPPLHQRHRLREILSPRLRDGHLPQSYAEKITHCRLLSQIVFTGKRKSASRCTGVSFCRYC